MHSFKEIKHSRK